MFLNAEKCKRDEKTQLFLIQQTNQSTLLTIFIDAIVDRTNQIKPQVQHRTAIPSAGVA